MNIRKYRKIEKWVWFVRENEKKKNYRVNDRN